MAAPSLGPDIFSNNQEVLWNKLLEDKLRQLKVEDQQRLRQTLNYTTFQTSLNSLLAKHKQKRTSKLLSKIEPVVSWLENFARAITSISQVDPFGSLGWGVAQLLLESAQHSYKVLSLVVWHLEDFAKTLPRCSDYVALFPHHPRLQTALQGIYQAYLDVCIDTAVYLEKSPLANLLFVYLSGTVIKQKFIDAKSTVGDCKENFEREVNYAHIESTSHVYKALTKTILSRTEVIKVTTLPFSRNASFICREDVLKRMNEGFDPKQPEPVFGTRSCVIHGMGGVGKTQTALEFAYKYSGPDCSIFWLQAEKSAELAETYSRIAKVLNLAKDSEIQDQTQLITLVQQWLSHNSNWLLIFDNAVNFSSIETYWPAYPHGKVILTTQNQDLTHSSSFSLHLKPMTDKEGARLLLRYLGRDDENSTTFKDDLAHAEAISKELEGLPIALAHVAGYMNHLQRPLPYFLEQFRERRQASAFWFKNYKDSTTHQYDRTLATIWDFALSALGPEARSIMDVMAMLSPEAIPEDMLLSEANRDPIEFDQMRIELLSRHLLRPQNDVSGSAFTIHRSLQKNLLYRLDQTPQARQEVFERTMKLIRRRFPVQSPIGIPVNHKWSIYERYFPHVLALHSVFLGSESGIEASDRFADLLCDAGYYMFDRNLGWEGIPILETAEQICLREENRHLYRLRANIGVAIGSLLNTIGISELHRALKLFDDVLNLRQLQIAELPLPHSQEDQLLLANAWNDKGWMRLESEAYAEGEECFEKSLKIKRQWPEKEIPFEFAETIKNLAIVRLSQARSKDALDLMRHALQLIEEDKESGPNSGTAQKFRLYMAEVLANSGETKEALDFARKVAAGRKPLYRPHHPFNLDVYYVQGILLHRLGDLSKAEEMLREALHEDIRDPHSEEYKARCLYALSEVLEELGKIEEAERHRKQAFELLDKWRNVFVIEVSNTTHHSVLFDHVVPFKCTRLSKHGRLWVGEIK